MPTQQEEMNKRFDEKLSRMITDLVWATTDGGQRIEPNRFLTYQEEPVYEFEQIKTFLQSEISLAVAQREKEMVEAIKETYFWKTCKIYFTPEQRQHFLSLITKTNDK